MRLQWFGLCFAVAVLGQPGVQPPIDPPALLARDASQKLQEWTHKGMLRDIQNRPPQQLLAEIQQANDMMNGYMETEALLYKRLGDAVGQDMVGVTNAGRVNWNQYMLERASSVGRSVNALYEQEERLNDEIKSLSGDNRGEAIRYRQFLEAELSNLRTLKSSLNDQRSKFEMAAARDPDKSRRDVLEALGKQKAGFEELQKSARDSEIELGEFYKSMKAYAERRAAAEARLTQIGPQTGQPTQPGSNARQKNPTAPITPASPAQVAVEPLPDGTVWSSHKMTKGTPETPALVEFRVTDRPAPQQISATVVIWQQDPTKRPEVVLNCHCWIEDNSITCNGESESLIYGVVLKATEPITGSIPSTLKIQASWRPKRGGGFPDSKMKEISISQQKAQTTGPGNNGGKAGK